MYVVVMTYIWIGRSWIYLYILRYCSAGYIYVSFRWGPFVHSLEIVQWDSTRRDHPGYPGRVSGSDPVSLVSELYVSKFLGVVHCCATHLVFCIPS